MLSRQKITRELNKVQKLWYEKGTNTVLKKAIHLTANKIGRPTSERTMIKRNSLLNGQNIERLRQDIERAFSTGLLRQSDKIKSDVRLLPDENSDLIIKEAQKILNHEFIIFGYLRANYQSNNFSWSIDPLTDFDWPRTRLGSRDKIHKPYGTDVKTIWEIARFQFLCPLAYAYALTGDKRFPQFAIDKVNSWIDENAFLHRPHWWIPMESAIRLINWCVYFPLLDILEHTDNSFIKKITQSVFEHLIFIHDNLEVSPSQATNHYLANLVGLIPAKQLFPSIEWAVECTEFATREFYKELLSQFKESGINFEGSLAYHRLSFEMCLMGVALLRNDGFRIPPQIHERLIHISDFTKYYSSTVDSIPLIGDNDSGIFVRFFSGQESNEHQYLGCLSDSILKGISQPKDFNDFLCVTHFMHPRPPHKLATHKGDKSYTSTAKLQVRDFDGLVIARSGSDALFFNTLQSSQGHTHNDKLSFYPVIDGQLLFLDRGSFSYTGFWRKRHEDRRTASHNCPSLNGWEQNTIWENDPFYNNGEAKCSCSTEIKGSQLTILGSHTGYDRYQKSLNVFRRIEWNTADRSIRVTDWLEGKTSHDAFRLNLFFLINPIWSTKFTDDGFSLRYNEKLVIFEDITQIGFEPTQGHYSPFYQTEKHCKALKASIKIGVGEKIHYRLRY